MLTYDFQSYILDVSKEIEKIFQGGESMKFSLKELRARHNLSQDDMAEKLGISRTTYSYWEKKPGNIAVSKAQKVADILQVTLDDILF